MKKINSRVRDIFSVFFDNSTFGWGIPMKIKLPQTITKKIFDSIHKSDRKPILMQTHDGNEVLNKFFTELKAVRISKVIADKHLKEQFMLKDLTENYVIFLKNHFSETKQ